jgi:glycosyltransferase involved in cell wall biosynthesis
VIIEEESFSLAAWRWSRAARRLGLPYAVQSAENLERRLPRIVGWLERSVLSHADWVMARSPAAGERAIRHGADHRVVDVVPHGIDNVRLSEPTPRSGVVGFVGRLTTSKGVGDLLEIAARRPDLTFEFVGDGELRDVVQSAGDNVVYRGVLSGSALNDFFASVSVVAVPSRTTPTWSEQFGRVIIEAQAQGTPVVAYDSGEIPWVANETSVVLVPEGDVEQFATALLTCAIGNEGRERGREGRTKVERRFTNAASAEQIRQFVTSATSR